MSFLRHTYFGGDKWLHLPTVPQARYCANVFDEVAKGRSEMEQLADYFLGPIPKHPEWSNEGTWPPEEPKTTEADDPWITVTNRPNTFHVRIATRKFDLREMIWIVSNHNRKLVIEGQHTETPDNRGNITRTFCRKYGIPDDVDADTFQSEFDYEEGILVLHAKKMQPFTSELDTNSLTSSTEL